VQRVRPVIAVSKFVQSTSGLRQRNFTNSVAGNLVKVKVERALNYVINTNGF